MESGTCESCKKLLRGTYVVIPHLGCITSMDEIGKRTNFTLHPFFLLFEKEEARMTMHVHLEVNRLTKKLLSSQANTNHTQRAKTCCVPLC